MNAAIDGSPINQALFLAQALCSVEHNRAAINRRAT
jgi:hypothetical protein